MSRPDSDRRLLYGYFVFCVIVSLVILSVAIWGFVKLVNWVTTLGAM